jgi:hypothetical protein
MSQAEVIEAIKQLVKILDIESKSQTRDYQLESDAKLKIKELISRLY